MKGKGKKILQWERMTSEEMVCVEAGKANPKYQTGGEPTDSWNCPCLQPIPTPYPDTIICAS